MERFLIGDAKAEFRQKANLAGSYTVANFTIVMNKMTAHIFPPMQIAIKGNTCKGI